MLQGEIMCDPLPFKNALLKRHCCLHPRIDKRARIKVVGLINSVAFQKARLCAEKLYQHLTFKFAPPQITEIFQLDWYEYIEKMKRLLGGKVWTLTRPVAIFINNKFIGSDVDFLYYINQYYVFSIPTDLGYYESLIAERCKQFMEKSKRKYVYFTFTVDGCAIGSLIFMLYSDLLPSTCQHFLNLCIGYNEFKENYVEPYYINTRVHRIVKNGWIQCGSGELPGIEKKCGICTFVIPDESYCVPHDRCGVLSMTNDGKHSNETQFSVCIKPNAWMNYYYVAFGQLVDGVRTLKTLENMSTYYEHPTKEIIISRCGEYIFEREPKLETGSLIFLVNPHQRKSDRGEDQALDDNFSTYSITPWLDNIVDKIDIRDTPSILMVEKYLGGLYCFSTDYIPGMDMQIYEKAHSICTKKEDNIVDVEKLYELFTNFQPDLMTQTEKLLYVSEISNIMLAYFFNLENNEYCLQHISTDTRVILNKILEVAHEIAVKSITKAKKELLIARPCIGSQVNKILEMKKLKCTAIFNTCLPLLQEILNEAILYLIDTHKKQE